MTPSGKVRRPNSANALLILETVIGQIYNTAAVLKVVRVDDTDNPAALRLIHLTTKRCDHLGYTLTPSPDYLPTRWVYA